MNVGILGLGYVGLTLGVVASLKKHKVYGVEINNQIINSINENKAHFFEPGLDSIITRVRNKTFFVQNEFEVGLNLDVIIITVGTPLKNDSEEPDLEHISKALEAINGVFDGRQLVILRSTVSVGSTRNIVLPILSRLSGVKESELLVAFCPERTVEGKAVMELQELPQIIGANNDSSLNFAEHFFRSITPYIVRVESLEAAELVKLLNNTYRDVHFAIGNYFNEISQKFNIDGLKLINAANLGYNRSNIALPGLVGGPCLSKDAYILTNNLEDSPGKQFIVNCRKYNESLENRIVAWVSRMGSTKKKIGLSGMAFKGVPETSDLRGSNSVNIASKLNSLGYTLILHDFIASYDELDRLGLGKCVADIDKLIDEVDILVILNNNSKYKNINFSKIISQKERRFILLDVWNVSGLESDSHEIIVNNLGNIELNYEEKI